MRLSSAPYFILNYALGATPVTFYDFALGGIGMVPFTISYVFIGTTLGSITQAATGDYEVGAVTFIVLVLACILEIIALIWLSFHVKKISQKYIDDAIDEENKDSEK